MNRIRRAIARWVYGAVACIHHWESTGVQHYGLLQHPESDRLTPMTSVLRRCRNCGDVMYVPLAGTWLLEDLQGKDRPAPSDVADSLIDASFKKGPAS